MSANETVPGKFMPLVRARLPLAATSLTPKPI
jgi:hypothetical protein